MTLFIVWREFPTEGSKISENGLNVGLEDPINIEKCTCKYFWLILQCLHSGSHGRLGGFISNMIIIIYHMD